MPSLTALLSALIVIAGLGLAAGLAVSGLADLEREALAAHAPLAGGVAGLLALYAALPALRRAALRFLTRARAAR